jgi:hypothetical protein
VIISRDERARPRQDRFSLNKKRGAFMNDLRLAWLLAASVAMAGCSMMKSETKTAGSAPLQLSGAQEVPALVVTGTGVSTIIVAPDGAVSGSVKTTGVAGNAAHIHVGAAGVNGPVIVPLTKSADNEFTVPAGAKLTEEQMKRFKAGELYVNVHTAANPGGEVRAQLKP